MPTHRRSRSVNIDWTHFTPWSSLAGGLTIGAAAAAFVLLNGRIAGISGIVGGLLRPSRGDIGWRVAFLLGLIGAPLAYAVFASLPEVTVDAGTPTLAAAGLLVGLGTRYGAGCTSGHGVCGLSRLSPRSLAATIAFMLAGFATVFAMRHLFA
nr:YeeE/YedE family protein [Massilia oculi]